MVGGPKPASPKVCAGKVQGFAQGYARILFTKCHTKTHSQTVFCHILPVFLPEACKGRPRPAHEGSSRYIDVLFWMTFLWRCLATHGGIHTSASQNHANNTCTFLMLRSRPRLTWSILRFSDFCPSRLGLEGSNRSAIV